MFSILFGVPNCDWIRVIDFLVVDRWRIPHFPSWFQWTSNEDHYIDYELSEVCVRKVSVYIANPHHNENTQVWEEKNPKIVNRALLLSWFLGLNPHFCVVIGNERFISICACCGLFFVLSRFLHRNWFIWCFDSLWWRFGRYFFKSCFGLFRCLGSSWTCNFDSSLRSFYFRLVLVILVVLCWARGWRQRGGSWTRNSLSPRFLIFRAGFDGRCQNDDDCQDHYPIFIDHITIITIPFLYNVQVNYEL